MTTRLWAAPIPAAVFGAWLLLAAWWTHGFQAFTSFASARVAAGPLPRPSPPLRVVDERSERWDVASPSDQYRLVQAMYLRCPDVCPIAMARLGLIAHDLEDLIPERLRVVSLSIDGDSPASLHDMWTAHGSRAGWSMASLVDAPPERTLKGFGVWMFRRRDGLINHGLDIFLLDRKGDVVDVLSPDEDAAATAERVRREVR